MSRITASDLKKALRVDRGQPLRKSKYRLDLYIPGEDTRMLRILCQSVKFPNRSMTPVKVFHKGRPYLMRSETEFGDSIDISFLEDSQSDIRRMLDQWFLSVDDPSIIGGFGLPYEDVFSGVANAVKSVRGVFNDVRSAIGNRDANQILSMAGMGNQNAFPGYQLNARIWQLDGQGNQIYGYELQNQFIQGISETDFSQNSTDVQEVTMTLQYQESVPLSSETLGILAKAAELGQSSIVMDNSTFNQKGPFNKIS